MFRSLSNSVNRRKENINKQYQLQSRVDNVISLVMKKYQPFISTQLKGHNLFITTKHKTVAQEIVLNAKMIHRALLDHKIDCNRIIVR